MFLLRWTAVLQIHHISRRRRTDPLKEVCEIVQLVDAVTLMWSIYDFHDIA